MKTTRKHALILAGTLAGLLVGLILWKSNFFLLPFATVAEDGHTASGYVYANSYRPSRVTHLLITRSEVGQQHSYLASIEDDPYHGGPVILDCEDWIAPHAPFFMFPDVNPPCIRWYAAEDVPPEPKAPKRNLKVKGQSFEFTANDGKRVTVSW